MKALGRPVESGGASSSIFGSAAGLAQSIESEEQSRIGFYPILCADEPELAMGLASCLCYLLEQYRDARVYRCFAKFDHVDSDAEISKSDYQFSIDDWELEGLADNVQLFGELKRQAGQSGLELTLYISFLEPEEVDDLSYTYSALPDLVADLPVIAGQVASVLDLATDEQAVITYAAPTVDSTQLARFLVDVFEWNLDVYLYLWGVDWAQADVRQQFADFAEQAQQSHDDFSRWCLGMLAKQVMQTGLEAFGEAILQSLPESFSADMASAAGVAAAALGLAELGFSARAVSMLEHYLIQDAPVSAWTSMIAIHLAGGRTEEAIDTCQRALEAGLDHPALYWEYAQLLMSADAGELPVEELLLIDPDDFADEAQIPAEIASALKQHLSKAADNLAGLHLALAYMIDMADEEIWLYFEQLVLKDEDGDFTGDIIERLLDLDDYERAYDILERAVDANSYAYVFLAQLAIADEDLGLAQETIADCRRRFAAIDDELDIELQRLELSARVPGFDEAFAEIKLLLSGGRQITEGQVELLEAAIETAPKMVDLYSVLARCYLSWKDQESALEVLADAEKQAGAHPQIDVRLAQILWARNQREEAMAQLNKALAAFPSDVNLLAQLAHFLIANDQLEDARQYIMRAETIAPSHRAIGQVRRLVAQKLAERA